MSTNAATDSVQTESVSANPSTDLNDPRNLDYEDDSDEQNAAPVAKAGTDPKSETDEAPETPDSQEAEDSPEQDAEPENAEAETETAEVVLPDDALVTLPNGEKVKFKDLRDSPMLKADYTQKTQALSNERRAFGEQASRLQNVTEAFVNFLAEQIPAEPTPDLALQDPGKFIQQKAIYDAAVARITGLIELGTKAKAEAQAMSDQELQAARADTAQKIADRLPFLSDPVKAQEFDRNVHEAAQFLGIPREAVARMSKPHEFLLAYYANLGIKAEQAQKKVAAKVQAAPVSTPAKTAQAKGNPQFIQNKEAMRRLQKSGSIQDAMSIDFD